MLKADFMKSMSKASSTKVVLLIPSIVRNSVLSSIPKPSLSSIASIVRSSSFVRQGGNFTGKKPEKLIVRSASQRPHNTKISFNIETTR